MLKQLIQMVLFASVCSTISGCATAVVGSLTLSQLSTIATVTTMTVQGKGVGEVALDVATGKDCRVMEGIVRQSRSICEVPGSAATDGDFKGVLALLQGEQRTDDTAVLMPASAPAPVENRPEFIVAARSTAIPVGGLMLQGDAADWAHP